jgi:DNA-binding NtrC family response regulator
MKDKKILLVDDEQDILEILSYNLKKKVTKFLPLIMVTKVLQKLKKLSQI